MKTTLEDPWRYDTQEISMMAEARRNQSDGKSAPPPDVLASQQQETTEKPVKHNGLNNWQRENEINAILEGKYIPETRSEAAELVQERFGCAYHALPEIFQKDEEMLMEATAQSSGHELGRAPEDVRAGLTQAFFINAVRKGARGWVLKWANDDVKNDKAAVLSCVRDCGDALQYASEAMRRDEEIQLAAVREHPKAITHAMEPSQKVQDTAKRVMQQNGTSTQGPSES